MGDEGKLAKLGCTHPTRVQLKFWKPWFPVEQASCLLGLDGQDAHPTNGRLPYLWLIRLQDAVSPFS
ncbi:MAG: hypothetical protein HC879_18385 [Leptolyngbyaceae cyanobacterium SL_5_9]|nr:hypothetical protein [Leptolyngbyaceae cyanobacterium SL_5_9]